MEGETQARPQEGAAAGVRPSAAPGELSRTGRRNYGRQGQLQVQAPPKGPQTVREQVTAGGVRCWAGARGAPARPQLPRPTGASPGRQSTAALPWSPRSSAS